jgi:hypothetical protein
MTITRRKMARAIYPCVCGIVHGVEYVEYYGVSEGYTASIFRVTEFFRWMLK